MLGEIVGGLLGQGHAQAGYDAQKQAINAMIAKLDQVGMPPDQSAAIILEQYKQAGILTPQLEQQVKDSVSQFAQIKTDQGVRNMQVKALQQMSQLGRTGMTADERAAGRVAQAGVQSDLEAKQQQIIQNLQARGQAGGGAEIAARLGSSQAAANRGSEEADRVSAMAAQRALAAISQGSSMAGQLRGQDYSEEAAKAEAQDQMNRFNVQNQMAINQRNVGIGNQAQASNLSNAQQISNANVGQTNQEKYNQLQRQRQFWTDKLNYAQSYSNPLQQLGNVGLNQEMSKAQQVASLGKSFDDTAFNIAGMMAGKPPTGGVSSTSNASANKTAGNDYTGKGYGGIA